MDKKDKSEMNKKEAEIAVCAKQLDAALENLSKEPKEESSEAELRFLQELKELLSVE